MLTVEINEQFKTVSFPDLGISYDLKEWSINDQSVVPYYKITFTSKWTDGRTLAEKAGYIRCPMLNTNLIVVEKHEVTKRCDI